MPFNIRLILNSGQLLPWKKFDKYFYIINGKDIIAVSEDGKDLKSYKNCDVGYIFRFDDDIDKINQSIAKDEFIKSIIKKLIGLRLVRQDPFQCLIAFICSSNTNVTRILHMIQNIIDKFGEKVYWKGEIFKVFPAPKVLSNASIDSLLDCGLGFRAQYVKHASKLVLDGIIKLEDLKYKSYEDAKEELKSIKGIGNKIADCILLLSLEHLDAFPIDRWILRILNKHYSINVKYLSEKNYRFVSQTMRSYFGKYAGYAQQYLYCYAKQCY